MSVEQTEFFHPKATSGPPCTVSTDLLRIWFCHGQRQTLAHSDPRPRSQAVRLCNAKRTEPPPWWRQGSPSSRGFPWRSEGSCLGASAPRHDRPVRCSTPRGEPSSSWFRDSLASTGTQGTGWDLVEQKHSLRAEQWAVCWLLPSRYIHCLFSKTEPHPSSSRDCPEPS